jgi:hypothetical protein
MKTFIKKNTIISMLTIGIILGGAISCILYLHSGHLDIYRMIYSLCLGLFVGRYVTQEIKYS